jgi:foldase protein PrsA
MLIAITVVGVAGCGGGGSDEIVARVQGVGSISKGTLEHWIPIEARLVYQEVPKRPVPKGVVPDPPTYTSCIAYLKTTKQKIVETGPKPTPAQLKSKCAHKYQEMKELALNTLIGWDWTIGMGAEAGMKASDAEARQRLEAVKKNNLPGIPFDRYLKYTGQTLSDMLLRSRVQLFEVKFQERTIAMVKLLPKGLSAQQRQKELAKLAARLPTSKQWVAKTSCIPGYVTSSCRQYKGSEEPGIPN